jgi:hypothetical protein
MPFCSGSCFLLICQIMRSCIGTVTKLAVMHVGRAPKYEIRNLLVKAFHLIYYMTTFLKHYFFALDDHCPTPSEEPQHIKFTSRNASLCRTSIWIHHTSGHLSVTGLYRPVREVLWWGANVPEPWFFHYF